MLFTIFILYISLFSFHCQKNQNIIIRDLELIKEIDKINHSDNSYFFSWVENIVINGNNDIIVADDDLKRIFIFHPDLTIKTVIGSTGQGPGEFMEITSIATDIKNNIYISDYANNRIVKFTENGEYISDILPQNGERIVIRSSKFSIDREGNIYVNSIDTSNLITIIDQKGNPQKSFGKRLEKRYRINNLLNRTLIHLDSHGNIMVMFYEEPLLVKFDSSLKMVWQRSLIQLPDINEIVKDVKDKRKRWIKEGAFNKSSGLFTDIKIKKRNTYVLGPGKRFGWQIYSFNSEDGRCTEIYRFNKIANQNLDRNIITTFCLLQENQILAFNISTASLGLYEIK